MTTQRLTDLQFGILAFVANNEPALVQWMEPRDLACARRLVRRGFLAEGTQRYLRWTPRVFRLTDSGRRALAARICHA